MSPAPDDSPLDLIRWTFTADPARRRELATSLDDLGAEVSSQEDGRFLVLWDEPDAAPFEVTHESFRRLELLAYQAEDEAEAA
jgi:hypothetical protein